MKSKAVVTICHIALVGPKCMVFAEKPPATFTQHSCRAIIACWAPSIALKWSVSDIVNPIALRSMGRCLQGEVLVSITGFIIIFRTHVSLGNFIENDLLAVLFDDVVFL